MKNNNMKKLKTKKELKQFNSLGRSTVGRSQNLGTIELKSPKDYDRKKAKRETRKEYLEL